MTDPVTTVSGDAEHGFIVEVMDGERAIAFGMMAETADAAGAEGLRRFHPPASVVETEPKAEP